MGLGATKSSIDRIRHSFDEEVFAWKSSIGDYLLLPSDVSTATIPFVDDDVTDTVQSMSVELSSASSPTMSIDGDQVEDLGGQQEQNMNQSLQTEHETVSKSSRSEHETVSKSSRSEHKGNISRLCY